MLPRISPMRQTMRRIHALQTAGKLPPTFNAALLNKLLGIDWAANFLPKHCRGNPGSETVHFRRVSRGLYCLK